jgi:hypothetical protein
MFEEIGQVHKAVVPKLDECFPDLRKRVLHVIGAIVMIVVKIPENCID